MSAKYKSPSFLLPNEINTNTNPLNTDGDSATGTGVNSLYSMDFDGNNEYIDLGTPSTFSFGTGDFSISGWVYLDTSSGYQWIFSTGTNFAFGFDSSRNLQLWVGGTATTPTFNINLNQWHHVVATRNSGTVTFYIDGAAYGTTYTRTGSISAGAYNYIGTFNIGQNHIDGKIDEVAIFNRALNTTEIAALYDGTGSNIRPSNLIASNLNPVAYYPLGEQAQNTGKLPEATANVWQFPNGVLQDYVMDFDGTSPGDAITNNNSGITGNAARTVSFWYNIGISSSAMIPFSLGGINDTNSNSQFAYCVNRSSTTTAAIFGRGGNDIEITVPATNDSQWHNVIITYTGSTLALYIDGSNITLLSQPSAYATTDGFKIGGWSEAGNRLFDGKMSNVAIWNTAITDANQIANIYNNGSPQTSYTVSPQNWWKLNATSVYTPSAPNYTTALSFDGTNSTYIDLNNITSLNSVSKASYSFWFKLTSNTPSSGSNSVTLIGSNAKGASCYFYGSNSFYIHNFNSQYILTTQPSLNNWHHVCCVFDSGVAEAYVDGSSVGTVTEPTLTTTASDFGNNFNVGYSTFYSDYINNGGQISNVALFNTALSASQVSTLFNFGTPETNISFSPQAWWKLNDQTTITDSSGNGNTGTNNGATNATTSVAVVPSWKISSALPITTTPNFTTALKFTRTSDPNSQYINFGTISSMNSGNLSVSLWIYIDNNDYNYIFESNNGGGAIAGIGCVLYSTTDSTYPNSLFFSRTTTDGKNAGMWPPEDFNIKRNKWQHLAFVFNDSQNQTKFYLNSTLLKTTNGTSGNTISPTQDLTLGRQLPRVGTNLDFNGNMSNFAIFNSILTNSQISTLYNNGTPETAISFSPTNWWKLDTGGSTITDYGSGGNNGTNNGPATQVTSDVLTPQPVNGVSTTLPSTALQQSDLQFDSPYSNYSLNFDGSGAYINTNFTIPAWTEYSISLWFKYTGSGNPTNYKAVLGAGSSGGNTDNRAMIAFSGTKFYANMGTGTGAYWYDISSVSVTELFDGNWHHIALSVFETGQNLYIDGSLKYQYSYSNGSYVGTPTTGFAGTSPYYINKFGSSGAGYLAQKIDELSFFDKKITDSEVLQIYNNGKPSDISSLSPKQWWRLGENAYFDNNNVTLPNSITGGPNGVSSGTATSMLSADAPGTYANGIGTNLDIIDRVGDAALSASNSQSYNMIPSDISPYVPEYVGDQIANNFSMTFNGTDQYVSAEHNSSLNLTTEFTVSMWVNISGGTNYRGLFTKGSINPYGYGSYSASIINNSNNKIRFYLGSSTSVSVNLTTNTGLSSNTWHHLAFVYNGSQGFAKIYINGSEAPTSSATIPSSIYSNTEDFHIGAYYSDSLLFDGKIDEVAIFDTALNAGQIYNDIYQPTSTGTNQTADLDTNPNLPTPVAWYRMGD